MLLVEAPKKLDGSILEGIKQYDDNLPVIVVSHSKEVPEVVRLMKMGVYEYFHFPIDGARLQMSIANAMRLYKLTKRVFLLENQLGLTQVQIGATSVAAKGPMVGPFSWMKSVKWILHCR